MISYLKKVIVLLTFTKSMTTLSKLHENYCGQELSSEEAREINSIVRNEQYIDMTFILNRHCAFIHQAFPTANRMSI